MTFADYWANLDPAERVFDLLELRAVARHAWTAAAAEAAADNARLSAELAATVEYHSSCMDRIEAALPKPRKNRDTERSKAIVADIEELAALREAMGQLMASAKACLRHADKYGFLPTNVVEVQVLNHQQYDRTDMTVAQLRAAVAAFDRAGENASPANLSSATVHGDDDTRKGG